MKEIIERLKNTFLKMQTAGGYFVDPVYNIIDPRPTAEICKSFLYLGYENEARKGFDWLLTVQQPNGSWLEVLPDGFVGESGVATSAVGRLLVVAYEKTGKREYLDAALKAGEYMLSIEFSQGYFIKSNGHYADVLNVDAMAAAHLYALYRLTKKKKYIEARDRAIYNVIRYLFKDGALPYAIPVRASPYEWHLNLRDPHYHALTFYFLIMADPEFKNIYLKKVLPKMQGWLEKVLSKKGFDWSEGKHTFSVGINSGYGYAAYILNYLNSPKSKLAVNKLKKIQRADGLFNRFDVLTAGEIFKWIIKELFEFNYISPTNFNLATKLKRTKNYLRRVLDRTKPNLKCSLFYSSQIFDCLTEIST